MSRPLISGLVLGAVTAAGVPAPVSAVAAELLPSAVAHVRHQHSAPWYGPCGCLHVSYDYHRELRPSRCSNRRKRCVGVRCVCDFPES
jgi:hypothetical protein